MPCKEYDLYKKSEKYNLNKKRKILFLMIYFSNKKLNAITIELFIWGRELSTLSCFIRQSYIAGLKNIRLNSTHYFLMEIPRKFELQQIALNHLWDIN